MSAHRLAHADNNEVALYAAVEGLHPLRFNVNRVLAERIFARIERHRTIMSDAQVWRNYAVAQIAAALDAAGSCRRPTNKGGSNVIIT